MSLYFADDDNITFGVQASNVAEAAQFSSTTNDVFVHLYTNNYQDVVENTAYGVAFGSSNIAPTKNDFYFGNITNDGSNVDRVMTIRENNVGIRTAVPQATLHIVGSNLPAAQSNVVLIQTINSPAYPAFIVDRQGYVGIGTSPTSNQSLTIRGKLVVDNLQVGGGSASDPSSKLLVAYGMTHPTDTTYLDFGYKTMSNISNIVTPLLQATNVFDTFRNISRNTFLDNTITFASAPTTRGDVTFTTNFYGNASSYVYTLTTTSNGITTNVNPVPKTTTGSVDSITATFPTGAYSVNIFASASNGSSIGSYFNAYNVATFTVPVTDLISTPSIVLSGSPSPTLSATTTTYSGVQYYTSGLTIVFPPSSIAFTNIYQTIDPVGRIPFAIRLNNASNYTHEQVFTNHLVLNAANTHTITYTHTSTSNGLLTIPATVYNVNGSNINTTFLASISYIGNPAAISETIIPPSQYQLMPIASISRLSTQAASPNVATITTFNPSSPSQYDALFSPFNATYYTTYTAIQSQLGTLSPSLTQIPGAHNQLTLRLTATSQLNSFVLNLNNATGSISSVLVNWTAINTIWYDASMLYTQTNGCAAAIGVTPTTRYPIRLPQSIADSTLQSDIYINITFSGSIPMSGITVS